MKVHDVKACFSLLISITPIVYLLLKALISPHHLTYLLIGIGAGVVTWFLHRTGLHRSLSQFCLGLLFSFMFLDIAFSNINLSVFVSRWKELRYFYLAPATGLMVLSWFIQTLRWRIILLKIKPLSIKQLFPSVMIGQCANHFLPAKAGEFVRSLHLGRRYNLDPIALFSTVILERIFDGAMVICFLSIFVMSLNTMGSELFFVAWWSILIYLFVFISILVMFRFKKEITVGISGILPDRFQPLFTTLYDSLFNGLALIGDRILIIKTIAYSVVFWVVIALSLIPIARMFDFYFPFYAPFAVLACICLGLALPTTPGGIGAISIATIFAMQIILWEADITVSETLYNDIVAFSLLINAVLVLPEIVVGVILAFMTGSGLRSFYGNEIETGNSTAKRAYESKGNV